jgi:iron complex transport system substrate-binding protein
MKIDGRAARHGDDDIMTPRAQVLQSLPMINRPHVDDIVRRDLISSAIALTVIFVRREDVRGFEDGEFPVTVAHRFGSTTIDSEPTRVVTFGPTDEDMVLALGRVPVGLTDWWGNYEAGKPWPWAEPLLAGTEYAVIPLDGEVHYEEILALQPDLIIGQYCGMTAEDYERLSQIAPTVAQSGDYEDWRTPWQVMSRTIAKALGKANEGDNLVTEVEATFARLAKANPQFAETTVLYVERGDGTFTIRGGNEPRVQVLTNMGLTVPEQYANLGEFGQEFSDEQLHLLDEADVIVWLTDEAGQAALEANPLFQGLRATQEAHNVFVTDETLQAAINWSSVLSLPYAAEYLATLIAEVL